MYKKYLKLIMIFITIFYCGCGKKTGNDIDTIIEEKNNILIGITYPTTGYKKLDKLIKEDVSNIYNDFKIEYEEFKSLTTKSELNIDYTYNIVNDNYIAITLNIFIDSTKNKKEINYIKSYNYDISSNKIIYLDSLIDDNNLNKLVKIINTELIKEYGECIEINKLNEKIIPNFNNFELFSFDEDNLYFYFNEGFIFKDYCGITEVVVPIKKISLLIKINKKNKETINYTKQVNKNINASKKVVALTFDDGPSKYTKEVIDILNKNNAVGTFFIIGNKVTIYKDTLKEMLKNGNEIGNHSYNHKWLTKLTIENYKDQLNKTQDILYEELGYKPTCMRPTYGSINKKIRNNTDLDIIMWSVDTMDWKYKSVDKIVSRATSNVKDQDIILMHDIKKRTGDALKKIIPILKEQGFEFVTVSELKEIKKIRNNN